MSVKRKPLPAFSGTEKSLSIYGYTDYRLYLKDFYGFRKSGQHGYSYRSFSKAAGFSSPNILKLVIEGQRNISQESAYKFVKALNLSGSMAEYFVTLVNMNQSKSDSDKEKYFLALRELTPQAKRRQLNAESVKYLSHWIFPVLREMAGLAEFSDDPYWIANRLHGKATVAEISSALHFLLKEGFVERTPDRRYVPKDNMVLSDDEVKNLAIRNFHRQMLEQAKGALETLDLSEREFGALTFILSESALAELKYKIKKFRSDLHSWAIQLAESKSGDVVVQVNFQMYPHTRKVSA